MSIYETGKGDELVNSQNYDDSILKYLEEEQSLLLKMVDQFNLLIEAGCMTGRYLNQVVRLNKKYIGIDPVTRYIDMAILENKHRISEKLKFINDDISNINSILEKEHLPNSDNVLLFFPFNSFGNIKNIDNTFNSILKSKIRFIIFTYKTDDNSNKVREQYYLKCGFTQLIFEVNISGVRITSKEGLDTTAYSENWVKEKLESNKQVFSKTEFGKIGVAYFNFELQKKN